MYKTNHLKLDYIPPKKKYKFTGKYKDGEMTITLHDTHEDFITWADNYMNHGYENWEFQWWVSNGWSFDWLPITRDEVDV